MVIFGPGRAENFPTGSAVSVSGAVSATDFFSFATRHFRMPLQAGYEAVGDADERRRQDATSGASSRAGDHVLFYMDAQHDGLVFGT